MMGLDMMRSTALAIVFGLVLGPAAHSQTLPEVLQEIEAELEAYEAALSAEESKPPELSSVDAAAELAAKQAELQSLLAQIAALEAQQTAAKSELQALLEDFSGDWTDTPIADDEGEVVETDPADDPKPGPAGSDDDPVVGGQDVADKGDGADLESGDTDTDPIASDPDAPNDGGTDGASTPVDQADDEQNTANSGLEVAPKDPLPPADNAELDKEDEPEPGPLFDLDESGPLKPRILSRPGAQRYARPGDLSGSPLDVFSVLYVLDQQLVDGETWYQIAESPDGESVGWIRRGQSQAWKNMLVMQYAPAADRDRVLFYRNVGDLEDLITDWNFQTIATADYASVDEGNHDPNRLVAIEPRLSVNANQQAYLMPILDWREESFDSGQDTVLLQLAGLNLQDDVDETSGLAGDEPLPGSTDPIKDFKIGIAFVVDTTRSMGPYIEQTKLFLAQLYGSLASPDLEEKFRFALVDYRDNTEPNEKIGHVTRVVRDFTDTAGQEDFVDTLFDRVDLAPVSTRNWREDALAGLDEAINELAWEEVDLKLIFLITDASLRDAGDELARDPDRGVLDITNLAESNDIAMYLLHMETPEARDISLKTEGYDDHERAQRQFRLMQSTGNQIEAKYFRISGDNEASFRKALSVLRRCFSSSLKAYSRGQIIEPGSCDQSGTLNLPEISSLGKARPERDITADEELSVLLDNDGTVIDQDNAGAIAVAVSNELFRAQQQYLGTRNGVTAPAFYRAWASDLDLRDPRIPSLLVSVLMTRSQIGDVAARLQFVVDRLNQKDLSTGEFFSEVRKDAGRTVIDPKIRDFLPEYLSDLPYCSKFLCIDRDQWDGLDDDAQEELLSEVERKLRSFKDLALSPPDAWLGLGDRSPENQVLPVPISVLP